MNPIEIDVVVAHVDVDVDSMQPVFFNDEIAVQTTVEKIENEDKNNTVDEQKRQNDFSQFKNFKSNWRPPKGAGVY